MKKRALCAAMAAAMTMATSYAVVADEFKPSAANKGIGVVGQDTDDYVVSGDMTKADADGAKKPALVVNSTGLTAEEEDRIIWSL